MSKEEVEIDKLKNALRACQRYAYRMQHDAGHSLDKENAKAIIRVVKDALGEK